MNGEEEVPIPNWLKNINYIISGLSIIVYIFYTYLLLRIKLKNWDYSLLIKAYLVFISFCQSFKRPPVSGNIHNAIGVALVRLCFVN